jgi:2-C-methyl-D-erythritol 4-phosphate cytidylyltransferase / 2-C-methyl-D-erythritol 2,4-cyclodiphosphate synthase
MRVQAAILCAGRGERFGSDKVLQLLGGRPVWKWSFDTFSSLTEIASVGLVCSPENFDAIKRLAEDAEFVVLGGSNRQESSAIAVRACAEAEVVLIHDGARPFVSADTIRAAIEAIEAGGAAAVALPSVDTLRARKADSSELLDRESVVAMQTPQGARRELLIHAHEAAGTIYTDDMAILEASGVKVSLVAGSRTNFKITTPEDLELARAMIGGGETRTGLGYDVHRFHPDPQRALYLGGVRFDEGPGLEGHSDADVLLHAAVDALLGAACLGDIGQHFPPSDPQWKDRPSSHFLKHAATLLASGGWRVVNLDLAVIAEKPKIMPRAADIRQAIAACLKVDVDRISVKATTNEGLGSIGRGEGIAAFATATISR